MPGYLIANIKVTDPEGFERYRAGVPEVIAQYGGRYVGHALTTNTAISAAPRHAK